LHERATDDEGAKKQTTKYRGTSQQLRPTALEFFPRWSSNISNKTEQKTEPVTAMDEVQLQPQRQQQQQQQQQQQTAIERDARSDSDEQLNDQMNDEEALLSIEPDGENDEEAGEKITQQWSLDVTAQLKAIDYLEDDEFKHIYRYLTEGQLTGEDKKRQNDLINGRSVLCEARNSLYN